LVGKVLCIVGQREVGKTTLIERLVPELKRRGYRVATVKRPREGFEFDTPGKDGNRHFRAGADATIVYHENTVAYIRRAMGRPSLQKLMADLLPDIDLVLVEGHKSAPLPKLEVFRSGTHARPLYSGQPDYLAIASDTPLDLGIPWLSLDDTVAIADFIAAHFPPALHGRGLSL
jgi:molybdopterin-guanine dinucleotide biosynthesis protein MobB